MLVWKKKLTTRADVLSTVKKVLNNLERVFTNKLYGQKSNVVVLNIYDSYRNEGKSIYQQLPIAERGPTRKSQKNPGANVIADP
jgi:hypothetical protein